MTGEALGRFLWGALGVVLLVLAVASMPWEPGTGLLTPTMAQAEDPPLDPESTLDGEEATTPVRVVGLVTDVADEPVRGARIRLSQSDEPGATAYTAETNRRGRWAVIGVWPPGRWNMRVEAEGFSPGEGSVEVSAEGVSTVVEVRLRPLDEASPRAAEREPAATAPELLERGNSLLAQKRPAEARAEYLRALELLPPAEQAEVLKGVARTHFVEGDVEATVETLERALRQAPEDAELRQLYSTLLQGRGRGQEAADFLSALPEESSGGAARGEAPAEAPAAATGAEEDLPPEIAARLAEPPEIAAGGMTGHHEVKFGEGSPLGRLETLRSRFAWSEDELRLSEAVDDGYQLTDESFHLYVPSAEPPVEGWGLVVWVAPRDWGGFESEGVAEVLDRLRLIWVSPNRSGNARPVLDRWRLALDAAAGTMELFEVDPRRVYVAGYSGGGRVASHLGAGFPDLFRGTLCWFGVDHFHPVPVPDRPGRSWSPTTPEPAAELFTIVRGESRFVLVTGEHDFNRAETVAVAEHLRDDGVEHVELMVIPGADHYLGLDPDWLERALTRLDGEQ